MSDDGFLKGSVSSSTRNQDQFGKKQPKRKDQPPGWATFSDSTINRAGIMND